MSDIMTKVDRRVADSRNRIASAIIELGQHHPIDSLTVGQLAAHAGISRSTFYAHFASLGDYLERSFGNMIEGHARRAGAELENRHQLLAVHSILAHVSKAPRYAAAISRSKHRPRMLAEGERRLAIVADEKLRELRPDLPSPRRTAMATFAAGGFVGTLRNWMEAGMTRPRAELEADFQAFTAALVGEKRA
jgi:AcrR family transcriptional regulator